MSLPQNGLTFKSFVTDGVTTAFQLTGLSFANITDIVVTHTPTGGVAVTLAPYSNFTLSGRNLDGVAQLATVGAALVAGVLLVERSTPWRNDLSTQNATALTGPMLEQALDELARAGQDDTRKTAVLAGRVTVVEGRLDDFSDDVLATASNAALAAAAASLAQNYALMRVSSVSALRALTTATPIIYDGSEWEQVNWTEVDEIAAVDTTWGVVARSTVDTSKAWRRRHPGVLFAEWFGALGESKLDMADPAFVPTRTNEGVPLKQAIMTANAMGLKLILDGSRVYIHDPIAQGSYGCWIPMYDGQSCVIDGQGCVFKFTDTMPGTHSLNYHLLYFIVRNNEFTGFVSNARIKNIDVRNITCDGNWRELPAPGGNPNYWASGASYAVGDIVQVRKADDEVSINRGSNMGPFSIVKCISANSDAIFDWSKWTIGTPGSDFYTYAYEQRAAIKVQAYVADGNFIENVYFENIGSIDPVADTISVGASQTNTWDFDGDGIGETPGIGNLTVRRCHAGRRRSTRAFVATGSQVGNIWIDRSTSDVRNADYRYNTIETEFSSIGTQKIRTLITGCVMDALEIGGAVGSVNNQYTITVTDSIFRDYFLPVRCNIIAERNDITYGIGNVWTIFDSIFSKNRIIFETYNVGGGVQDIRSIALSPPTGGAADILFEHNDFGYKGLALAGAISRYVISVSNLALANIDKYNVRLVNNRFPSDVYGSFNNYAAGTAHSRSNRFGGTTRGVQTGNISGNAGSWNSVDDDFLSCATNPFFLVGNVAGTVSRVSIKGGRFADTNFGTSGANYRDMIGVCERLFKLSAAPAAGGLAGDIVQLDDAAYTAAAAAAPIRWLCVQSHPTAATWISIAVK